MITSVAEGGGALVGQNCRPGDDRDYAARAFNRRGPIKIFLYASICGLKNWRSERIRIFVAL
jgi:hypothetical protein